jgi:crotonobetainyl-CoA:carnitine CoA-transferase CaiB-like acyl-CoA transferase
VEGQLRTAGAHTGPLQGIRVLEFGQILAAPHCGLLLKALGAEVIKVERPPRGDPSRHDPFLFGPGLSGYFLQQNIGKRSLCLDLRHPDGRDVLRALVPLCDVVLENLRPGVLDQAGLGYQDVRSLRQDIVMCSISAYGKSGGPRAGQSGFGPIVEALVGIPDQTGDPDGPPMPTQVPIADYVTASHAFGAIVAALFLRERTGVGSFIDMALLDCAFAMHDWAVQIYLGSQGRQRLRRRGLRSEVAVPWGMFRCRDREYVLVMAETDSLWAALARLIADPTLTDAARFGNQHARTQHAPEVYARLQAWIDGYPTAAEAVRVLEGAGIPATRVNDVADAVNHEEIRARQMIVEVDDPTLGRVRTVNVPLKLSHPMVGVGGHYPLLGQDNEYVLRDLLGRDGASVAALYRRGVLHREGAPAAAEHEPPTP